MDHFGHHEISAFDRNSTPTQESAGLSARQTLLSLVVAISALGVLGKYTHDAALKGDSPRAYANQPIGGNNGEGEIIQAVFTGLAMTQMPSEGETELTLVEPANPADE